jgi:phosphoglycolate phosphatase
VFDGVIFDLDGTLLDSIEDIANAANEVLGEFGKMPLPVERYQTLVGDGVAVLMERLMPETSRDIALRKSCMDSFDRHYENHWNKRSKPYEGIMDLLNFLADAAFPMGILSNKPEPFTKRCASYFFPHVPFSIVLGHSERFPKKPDPTSSLWIAKTMGISADCMAYVGDTNTDMKTAVAAGFFAMGVSWGFRTRDELIGSGARVVFDHPADLLAGLVGN